MKTFNEDSERIGGRLNPFQSSAGSSTVDVSKRRASIDVEPIADRRWLLVNEIPAPEQSYFMEGKAPMTAAYEQLPDVSFGQSYRLSSRYKRAVEFRPATLDDEKFQVLQKWEGKVTDLGDGFFVAQLKNLTENTADEEAEIEIDEVLPDDRELVNVGSAFYWSIGYLHKSHGQRVRASEIRFRRVPGWTEDEIGDAKKQVHMDGTFFNFDCGNSTA